LLDFLDGFRIVGGEHKVSLVAESRGEIAAFLAVVNGDDWVAEGLGELNTETTKAADTDDAYGLARLDLRCVDARPDGGLSHLVNPYRSIYKCEDLGNEKHLHRHT
jgi:hypothetical protein